jgi:2-polyprenyl-3-methyl-5-hydroxy-6-metoxy-1,4-benzoquinol methylase
MTLRDVIEHTLNPREVLDRCRVLLKPGGVLVVNYPDIGSWVARALGRRCHSDSGPGLGTGTRDWDSPTVTND